MGPGKKINEDRRKKSSWNRADTPAPDRSGAQEKNRPDKDKRISAGIREDQLNNDTHITNIDNNITNKD